MSPLRERQTQLVCVCVHVRYVCVCSLDMLLPFLLSLFPCGRSRLMVRL